MKRTCEDFRWMILYDFKKILTLQECLVSLCETLGNNVPSEKTIFYIWFTEFVMIVRPSVINLVQDNQNW